MPDLIQQLFPDHVSVKPLGLIVDLDETVCTAFSVPIRAAIEVLLASTARK